MNIAHIYMRIKSRALYLLKLEQVLRHLDDERYLRIRYRIRMGQKLDLKDPKKFSEKLQWLKLNDRHAIYTTMVDKHEVKKWVADRIGASHVIPNLGVWDSFDEIDFDALPEQFVLKCTHDSGGLAICDDRSTFNIHAARRKIEKSLSRNYYYGGREWPYLDVKPRILAEVYLPTWMPSDVGSDSDTSRPVHNLGILDYKFYCFQGEPKFLYVSQGLDHHATARMGFLTLDWESTGFVRSDYLTFVSPPRKPSNLQAMIAVARELSAGIPFVRVDLYEHRDRVLFSEMTFTPVSGMMPIEPKSADRDIGQLLDLSTLGTVR